MRVSFLLVGLIALLAAFPQAAHAQDLVADNRLTVDYPLSATFTLDLTDSSGISAATLVFSVEKFTCVSANTLVPVAVTGNALEWTWIMNRSGNPPPGVQLNWYWELTDRAGNVSQTAAQTYTFTDERFSWQSVDATGLTLHWYSDDDVGPALLDAAVAGLDRLENEMGITLTSDAQIFIYDDFNDLRDTLIYVSNWAGGVAFSEYNVILLGVPSGSVDDWGIQVVQHELAHLVLGQFGRSCVGGVRPTWLEEGLAVYAEGAPDETVLADIEAGISENTFDPIRSLTGAFPADREQAGIAYSQSYSIVDYLYRTYDRAQMQQLILTIADGVDIDTALETIYGFNQDGLETEWRADIGAPSREIPPTPVPLNAGRVPTAVPLDTSAAVPTAPVVEATPLATEENPGFGCALGLIPLIGLIFIPLGRRRRKL